MSVPETPVSTQYEQRMLENQRQLIVATYVAAIVTAAGRPHSMAEVLALRNDMNFALFPRLGVVHYQEWEKTKDATLEKVHA